MGDAVGVIGNLAWQTHCLRYGAASCDLDLDTELAHNIRLQADRTSLVFVPLYVIIMVMRFVALFIGSMLIMSVLFVAWLVVPVISSVIACL
jgi:hypothetical protein